MRFTEVWVIGIIVISSLADQHAHGIKQLMGEPVLVCFCVSPRTTHNVYLGSVRAAIALDLVASWIADSVDCELREGPPAAARRAAKDPCIHTSNSLTFTSHTGWKLAQTQ